MEDSDAALAEIEFIQSNDDDFFDTTTVPELMGLVSQLRAHLVNVRGLCESQKVAIAKLTKLNDVQHELLISNGLSVEEA